MSDECLYFVFMQHFPITLKGVTNVQEHVRARSGKENMHLVCTIETCEH